MTIKIVNDPNAGNNGNTTYRRWSNRPFRVKVDGAWLRDASGKVRSFASKEAAEKGCKQDFCLISLSINTVKTHVPPVTPTGIDQGIRACATRGAEHSETLLGFLASGGCQIRLSRLASVLIYD